LPWEARLIVRGRAGAILEDHVFDRVPLSLRFFAGGDNSVRGYDYESLGPRNALGELIGGNRVFEASVEYEHPLTESWSIATFVDAGNAFLGSDFKLRTGAGIGARWFTPIGPIRLDVAWPIDMAPGEDAGPRLHISLGPDL
jgi:translocation and assembly module TamA